VSHSNAIGAQRDTQEAEAERAAAPILLVDKIFFGAVAFLAVWVAGFGWFAPGSVDRALPWMVPPLHARFLGAMYVSGATFMVGALLAKSWPAVRVVVPMISAWTGALFLVSVLRLADFDFTRPESWVWFSAYLSYPLIAAWITWRMRANRDRGNGPGLSPFLRRYLVVQGIVLIILAIVLFLAPDAASQFWPWPISALLAQIYAAPFFSYGAGSLYAARQQTQEEVRLFLIGTAVFAAGVLLASVLHLALFSAANPVAWLWFTGFGVIALAQGVALVAHTQRP